MGDYSKAEPLLREALEVRRKVLGPEHPDTAQSLNNLAALYWTMSDYRKAEPLFKETLAILHKVLGPKDPDTASSLNNLAEPERKRSGGLSQGGRGRRTRSCLHLTFGTLALTVIPFLDLGHLVLLVDLLLFGIPLLLTEVLVIVRELIHGSPEEAHQSRAHGIEPL
jgi:tetratricopeptide (TPR) repeat protein